MLATTKKTQSTEQSWMDPSNTVTDQRNCRAQLSLPSNTLVEHPGGEPLRPSVRSSDHVEPHEEVAEVVLEELVVNVVVAGGAQAELAEDAVPGEGVLRVDEGEPVGIHGAEGHVSPDVASPDDVGGGVEGNEDHEDGVSHRPVEGIEQPGVGEAVVGLVGDLVDLNADLVLGHVHRVLYAVLQDKAGDQVGPLDGTLERVVRRGH